jgi:hypothetical protein
MGMMQQLTIVEAVKDGLVIIISREVVEVASIGNNLGPTTGTTRYYVGPATTRAFT